ncbi:MAG TPA: amidohydrolase family protein [Acidimicrobiia bacterium]|nr:amidohydrolase family protein [Acidimicrobiia bacterium]
MEQRTLLRAATVLTLESGHSDLVPGEVLIEGGRIIAVGEELDPTGAELVDLGTDILMPGFIDTHRHTWQAVIRNIAADWAHGHYMTGIHNGLSQHFRPQDTYVGNLLGTLEAVNSGITTLVDWSHNLATPEHADAAVQALFDSGSRAVFAHGGGAPQWRDPPSAVPHPDDAIRVRDAYFKSDEQLVTMAMALRGPQFTTKEVTLGDFRLARGIGVRITVHVGDGEWGRSRPIAWLEQSGLLGDDVTYVHCNTLADDELEMIAASGGTASVAADIELSMGHGWPATGRLLAVGIRPSLSIDVCTLNGGDMFGAMKATIAAERALRHAAAVAEGRVLEELRPTTRDVVEFATIEGARAIGLLGRIGTITPGKQADLISLSTRDPAMFPVNNPFGAIVYSAHPGVVENVMVDGRWLKRGGQLVNVDLDGIRRAADESRDYLFARARQDPAIPDARTGGDWFPRPMVAITE